MSYKKAIRILPNDLLEQVQELSEKYFLSLKSIQRIIREQRKTN